jgi:hypothetical protein
MPTENKGGSPTGAKKKTFAQAAIEMFAENGKGWESVIAEKVKDLIITDAKDNPRVRLDAIRFLVEAINGKAFTQEAPESDKEETVNLDKLSIEDVLRRESLLSQLRELNDKAKGA